MITTKTKLIVKEHHAIEELRDFCKSCKDANKKNKVNVILNIREGKTRKEVAELLKVSVDSISNWIIKYNKKGLEGLGSNKGGSKEGNPKWDKEIFIKVVKEIDKEQGYWSMPKIKKIIKNTYGLDIPKQTIWYNIKKLNYTYKSARPHPEKGNKEDQEIFKKGG